jgi:hypothetical protein
MMAWSKMTDTWRSVRFSFPKRRATSSTDAEFHDEDMALEARIAAELTVRDALMTRRVRGTLTT